METDSVYCAVRDACLCINQANFFLKIVYTFWQKTVLKSWCVIPGN